MKQAADRSRLVAILGLLGSAHDGEKVNAADAATRMLHMLHLTWDEVIGLHQTQQQETQSQQFKYAGHQQTETQNWLAQLQFCRRHLRKLSVWEFDFVSELGMGPKKPTPNQLAKLFQIVHQLRQRGCA